MNKWDRIIPILILASSFLSACSSPKLDNNQTTVNGDIREVTKNKDILPTFLKGADQQISAVYSAASEHTDMLQYIPCYCGCGESAVHKSNLDCFIHETKPDGSIVWDSHGTTCNTCLNIAAEAVTMQANGKSSTEIRRTIETNYKEGYAKPTVTPMPPAGK